VVCRPAARRWNRGRIRSGSASGCRNLVTKYSWRTFENCGPSRTAIARATRWTRRSWHDTRDSIRRFFGHLPPECRSTGSTYPDLDSQIAGPSSDNCGDRSARPDEALRRSPARFLYDVFCEAVHGGSSAWTRTGTWAGARTDRFLDGEDHARRSFRKAVDRKGVSRHRSHHRYAPL